MKYAGIDYSMTCPCITIFEGKSFEFDTTKIHYLTSEARYECNIKNITGTLFIKPENQMERFDKISNWALDLVKDCDKILIEDYSMGSKGKVFHIAENTALLKYKMYSNSINYSAFPPTSLKKYASGKGNSDKNAMYKSFVAQTNINLVRWFTYKGKKIASPISDIVDSYFLCKYCVETDILE